MPNGEYRELVVNIRCTAVAEKVKELKSTVKRLSSVGT